MRTDIEFLRGLTRVFLDAESPMLSLTELEEKGFDVSSEKGIFHYMLLVEQGFISDEAMDTSDIQTLGFLQTMGGMQMHNASVRLTASGMEFASALENDSVFERLKNIGQAPMSVIKDVGIELLKSYLKKQFGLSD